MKNYSPAVTKVTAVIWCFFELLNFGLSLHCKFLQNIITVHLCCVSFYKCQKNWSPF